MFDFVIAYILFLIAFIWIKTLEVKDRVDNPEDIICPVCGYYCLGKGGTGCIDKPFFVRNFKNEVD